MYALVSCFHKCLGFVGKLFLYFVLQKCRNFIQDLPTVSSIWIWWRLHQELHAVVLYAVMFLPCRFLLASVLTPGLVRHNTKKSNDLSQFFQSWVRFWNELFIHNSHTIWKPTTYYHPNNQDFSQVIPQCPYYLRFCQTGWLWLIRNVI